MRSPGGRPPGDRPRRSAVAAAARGWAGAPQEIHLIGGHWKRTRLPVPHGPGIPPGLRPTPARVRETLFNWLGQDLTGWRCLDAFAGTGALGFEAASRGAAEVVMLEQHPKLLQALHQVRQRLAATQVRIERADALAWMRAQPVGGFDLVLLDPPFDASLLEPAVRAAARLIGAGGWIYAESGDLLAASVWEGEGLTLYRHDRAGAVHAHLLRGVVGLMG